MTEPVFSGWPQEPKEQADQRAAEESRATASLPVIADVLAWFDAQIATYSNPTTITGINPNTDPQAALGALLLAQSLIKDYESKRQAFSTQFAKYIQEEPMQQP